MSGGGFPSRRSMLARARALKRRLARLEDSLRISAWIVDRLRTAIFAAQQNLEVAEKEHERLIDAVKSAEFVAGNATELDQALAPVRAEFGPQP